MTNSLVKTNFYCSAFASCRHARVLAAGMQRQDLVYITTEKLFCYHNNKIDEMPCKLDHMRIRVRLGTTQPSALRQGWVLFKRTCVFSGIPFTKHFIELVFVKTNEVVRSNSNVILTRQACGQRSSRVAGRKRGALAF